MGKSIMSEGWKNWPYECTSDMETCLYGTCCPQMMWAHGVTLLHPWNPIQGIKHMICLGLCGMGQLKADAREKYNIEGTCFDDYCMGLLCAPCTNCQVYKEVKAREVKG